MLISLVRVIYVLYCSQITALDKRAFRRMTLSCLFTECYHTTLSIILVTGYYIQARVVIVLDLVMTVM